MLRQVVFPFVKEKLQGNPAPIGAKYMNGVVVLTRLCLFAGDGRGQDVSKRGQGGTADVDGLQLFQKGLSLWGVGVHIQAAALMAPRAIVEPLDIDIDVSGLQLRL